MPIDAIETKFRKWAHNDVVGFKSLTAHGADVGHQMLRELCQKP